MKGVIGGMSREVIIRISDREYKDYYANDPSTKEVIRCKDCRFYCREIPCISGTYDGCSVWIRDDGNEAYVEDDDYCSFGERSKT